MAISIEAKTAINSTDLGERISAMYPKRNPKKAVVIPPNKFTIESNVALSPLLYSCCKRDVEEDTDVP